MSEVAYSFRRSGLSRERTYRLGPDALEWSDVGQDGRIAYAEIEALRFQKFRIRGALAATVKRLWACVLTRRNGRKIILLPTHYVRSGVLEDRSAAFYSFVGQLTARVRAANPAVRLGNQDNWRSKLSNTGRRLGGTMFVGLLQLGRQLPFGYASDQGAWVMRRVGPWLRGHDTARANLVAAYPEKSKAEIERILIGMWDNIGRVGAEYAHFDRLWGQGRIECDPATTARLTHLRDDGKPALLFCVHLAGFELGGTVCSAHGLELAILQRPPHDDSIATALAGLRARAMPTLTRPVQAGFGAALAIDDALAHGAHVAMLVDQHFADGVEVAFFGRPCKVNPAIAKFARRVECAIHGARVIRLPGHRFRFELTDAIDCARDARGRIDVPATMQLITSMIETWVREHPEQWIWAHRRWR